MKCLLDMDGVLVDFVGGACTAHGKPSPYLFGHTDPDFYPAWGLTKSEFWAPLKADFWASLHWTPEGQQILHLVESRFGAENVCILSSPSSSGSAGCVAGKLAWIERHTPQYRRRFLFGPRKEFCARHEHVLVDDNEENVRSFQEHGGVGVLVPRPWNSNRGKDPLTYVRNAIG